MQVHYPFGRWSLSAVRQPPTQANPLAHVPRCYRLNKTCRPADSVRRRNSRRPPATKKARLEEKLDTLVSLIKAGASTSAATTSLLPTASSNGNTPHGISRTQTDISADGQANSSSSSSVISQHNRHMPEEGISSTDSTDFSYEPSPLEAEQCLTNFQTYYVKYFPVVEISGTTTAERLRQERPFLWLCIMAVGSRSTSKQQTLRRKIRQIVAEEMVVQTNRSIDLLQGILVFVGWCVSCGLPTRIATNYSVPGLITRSRTNLFCPSLLSSLYPWCSILASTGLFLSIPQCSSA
jgi:hypothetical protein